MNGDLFVDVVASMFSRQMGALQEAILLRLVPDGMDALEWLHGQNVEILTLPTLNTTWLMVNGATVGMFSTVIDGTKVFPIFEGGQANRRGGFDVTCCVGKGLGYGIQVSAVDKMASRRAVEPTGPQD